MSKRSTIIGTPHWMAPELVSHLGSELQSIRYGTEVDCWAFGCAVYEMATGHPPNARVHPGELGMTLHTSCPRLEGDRYSEELKDFVAFLIEERPDKRPSASQILEHSYLKDTETKYPTEIIRDLIEYFAKWESEGGQRVSLFNPFGAAGPTPISADTEGLGEWNFSTTQEFDKRMSLGLDPFNRDPNSAEVSTFDKILEEHRIKRGQQVMKGIFSMDEKPYAEASKMSDLPFRNIAGGTAADRTTLIDIDAVIPSFEDGPGVELDDVPTLRARKFFTTDSSEEEEQYPTERQSQRRATKDWKFPFAAEDDANANRRTQDWTFPKMVPETSTQTSRKIQEAQAKNRDTRDWKFPSAADFAAAHVSQPRSLAKPNLMEAKTMPPLVDYSIPSTMASSPDRTSMIDLDAALSVSIPEISRPQTADSATDSAITDMTSGDPFDLEPEMQLSEANNRGSFHSKSQSEPTAGFSGQGTMGMGAMGTVDDYSEFPGVDANLLNHNRSSSVNRESSQARSTGSAFHQRWSKSSGGMDTSNRSTNSSYGSIAYGAGYGSGGPWDPFASTQDTSLEERLALERRMGGGTATSRSHERRGVNKGSTGSARMEDMGTLRPPHMRGAAGSHGNIQYGPGAVAGIRIPRDANRTALLPGADRRIVEEELAVLFEELGNQAEVLGQLIGGLPDNENEVEGMPI
jgi:protein-serine/threonine kinase